MVFHSFRGSDKTPEVFENQGDKLTVRKQQRTGKERNIIERP